MLPRNLRRAILAGGLAVLLGTGVAFAATQEPGAGNSGDDALAAQGAPDVTGRENVWLQVSRSDGERPEFETGPSVTYTVAVDGQALEITSAAPTLADALVDNGIVVGLEDVVSAPMNEQPLEGAEITVTRVGEVYETDTESIPFETIEQQTSTLERGQREVQTEGVEGSRVVTSIVTYENGAEISRVVQTEILAAEPVDEVILVGTREPEPERPTTGGSSSNDSDDSDNIEDEAPAETYSGGDPRAIAQSMLGSHGWGQDQWSCLNSLWQRESNWNPYAQNPSSGAYGIPQSLPGSKMASAGSDWRTNPATQIEWGLNYIDGRYDSPCGAWAHSERVGWY